MKVSLNASNALKRALYRLKNHYRIEVYLKVLLLQILD